MNKNEVQIAKKLEDEGWKIVRGGWPDLLCVKVDDGKIIDFQFVEVKSENDRLSYSQEIVKKVLSQFGKYKVERIRTNQTTPIHPFPNQPEPTHTTRDHSVSISNQANPPRAIPAHPKPTRTEPNHPNPSQANPDHSIRR